MQIVLPSIQKVTINHQQLYQKYSLLHVNNIYLITAGSTSLYETKLFFSFWKMCNATHLFIIICNVIIKAFKIVKSKKGYKNPYP